MINNRFGVSSAGRANASPTLKVGTRGELKNIFHEKYFKHWLAGLPHYVAPLNNSSMPTIMAVGGGKGGVGKSIVSSNLSAKLADTGHKVLTIDLDIGGSNLHTYFGKRVATPSLTDFIADASIPFGAIITSSGIHNVSLVTSGQAKGLAAIELDKTKLKRIWEGILSAKSVYGFDTVVIDLGAGTDEHTTDFFLAAHVGVVTVLPEPTSIENAYTFLKAVLWKLIQNAGSRVDQINEAQALGRRVFSVEDRNDARGYFAKLLVERDQNPQLVNCIIGGMMGRKLGFVVNQIRSQKDIEIANSMAEISRTYFGWKTLSLGYLNYDEAAWKSLRNKKLLTRDFPHSLISKRMDDMVFRAVDGLTSL